MHIRLIWTDAHTHPTTHERPRYYNPLQRNKPTYLISMATSGRLDHLLHLMDLTARGHHLQQKVAVTYDMWYKPLTRVDLAHMVRAPVKLLYKGLLYKGRFSSSPASSVGRCPDYDSQGWEFESQCGQGLFILYFFFSLSMHFFQVDWADTNEIMHDIHRRW